MCDNRLVAKELARAGLWVFPVSGYSKKPAIPQGQSWRDHATIYGEHIHTWPDYAMPAIDLARCGLVVVDCDRHGGPDGVELFKAASQGFCGIPPHTPVVRSPRNGLHFYFRQPEGREPLGNARGNLPGGVDIRGFGGFIVAPGAILADGRLYEPVEGTPDLAQAFCEAAIPEIPPGLIDIIEAPKRAYEARAQYAPPPAPRDATIDARWAAAALGAECEKIAGAGEGLRNHTLFIAASAMGSLIAAGYFSRQHVEQSLLSASLAAGLTQREAAIAMKSGIDRGLTQPRQRPERQNLAPTARRYSFSFPKKATA